MQSGIIPALFIRIPFYIIIFATIRILFYIIIFATIRIIEQNEKTISYINVDLNGNELGWN